MTGESSLACRICKSDQTQTIDRRDNIPVFSNKLPPSRLAALDFPLGELHLVGCRNCGFVWNEAYKFKSISFDGDYEQDGTHSEYYRTHLDRIARAALATAPAGGPLHVLEVGCGQGQFFEHLMRCDTGERIRTLDGFDPAYRGTPSGLGEKARIHSRYFEEDAQALLRAKPNLIVLRHVLGYLADPVSFLQTIRRAVGEGPAMLFLESPDVAWVLESRSAQDIFYETCSYYTPSSFAAACRLAGFELFEVEPTFGGQYFVASARVPGLSRALSPEPPTIPNLVPEREAYVSHWRSRLEAARLAGPVAVWGAAAKGVGFAQLIDPDATLIRMLVDINPAKQGRFVPATGHAILSAEDAVSAGVRTIVVANPLYRDEVQKAFADLGGRADVIGLTAPA